MKSLLKAALVASLMLAAQARAELLTYEFTAVITEIREQQETMLDGSVTTELVSMSDWGGFLMTMGEKVHGRFSFDTSTELEDFDRGPEYMLAIYRDSVHGNAISATFGSSGFEVAAGERGQTTLVVNDRADRDSFNMWNEYTDGDYFRSAGIFMGDGDGNTFPSQWVPALPHSIDTFGRLEFGYFAQRGLRSVGVSAVFTSVHQVSPVPEPGTYAMLLAGLGLIGWQRKRASRAQ